MEEEVREQARPMNWAFPLLLFLYSFFLFFNGFTANDLWSAHEARAAQNAQRMIDDRCWLSPRLYDGQVELQKPPAFYWLVAAIAELRGGIVDRWAVRLPSALAALALVFMVWGWLRARGRPLAGAIAGVALASSLHFCALARTGRIDMVLAAVTTAIVMLAPTRGWLLAVPLAGFALLLKGPIGIVLPLALLDRRGLGRAIGRVIAIALGGVAVAWPWFAWMEQATNGEFSRVFFWRHNVDRALGDSADLATHPWWYYLPRFLIDFLPATPLLITGIWWSWQHDERDPEARFGLLWMTTIVGLLSLAQFKRSDYLLPAYPGAAILVGCVAERWFNSRSPRPRRWSKIAFGVSLAVTVAGWEYFHRVIEPRQQAVREQEAFARFTRTRAPAPAEILLVRVESHLLAYHLGRPLRTLVAWEEINERLAEPGEHYFITRVEYLAELRQEIRTRRFEVVAFSDQFAPARPLRPLVLSRTIDE
jgi:4-amino-4-deoxy-L-arabinose transferase-like glycosyltransferase